jgi:predicted small lipoprotein YifL
MTSKSIFLSAAALAMIASLSACGSRNAGENLVQV